MEVAVGGAGNAGRVVVEGRKAAVAAVDAGLNTREC